MILEQIPERWNNSTRIRDDLKLAQKAKDMGFAVEVDCGWVPNKYNTVPMMPLSFTKENKCVWKCILRDRIIWRGADIINNRYQNHRTYTTLEEALNSEK